MSERTSYAPGTPCWVELGSPDLDASIEFYGALFGWDVPESANAKAMSSRSPKMLRRAEYATGALHSAEHRTETRIIAADQPPPQFRRGRSIAHINTRANISMRQVIP